MIKKNIIYKVNLLYLTLLILSFNNCYSAAHIKSKKNTNPMNLFCSDSKSPKRVCFVSDLNKDFNFKRQNIAIKVYNLRKLDYQVKNLNNVYQYIIKTFVELNTAFKQLKINFNTLKINNLNLDRFKREIHNFSLFFWSFIKKYEDFRTQYQNIEKKYQKIENQYDNTINNVSKHKLKETQDKNEISFFDHIRFYINHVKIYLDKLNAKVYDLE